MRRDSSLTEQQRGTVLALFEEGYGANATATMLGYGRGVVESLYIRWRIRGGAALVARSTHKRYPFEVKLEVVQRFLAGETKIALAKEFGLGSHKTVSRWARIYVREGDAGLQPKTHGRPRKNPNPPRSDMERLEQENAYLRAEVAYLKKLRALRAQEQQ